MRWMGLDVVPSDWVVSGWRSKQGEGQLLCAELAEMALPYKEVEAQKQMTAGGRGQLLEGGQGHPNQICLAVPWERLGSCKGVWQRMS